LTGDEKPGRSSRGFGGKGDTDFGFSGAALEVVHAGFGAGRISLRARAWRQLEKPKLPV